MCNFKSEVEKYNELMAHYSASFDSIAAEMDVIREKFSTMITKDDALNAIGLGNPDQLGAQLLAYNEKDALPATLTKQELTEMRWYQRFLSAYGNPELHQRFYENAFDHLPMPIVTSGEPDKFKFFRWGLCPSLQEAKPTQIRRE